MTPTVTNRHTRGYQISRKCARHLKTSENEAYYHHEQRIGRIQKQVFCAFVGKSMQELPTSVLRRVLINAQIAAPFYGPSKAVVQKTAIDGVVL